MNVKKSYPRILSLILLAVMVLGLFPAQAKPVEDNQVSLAQSEGKIVDEVVEKREQYTKHFVKDDGTYVACVYPEAVHFEQDGRWEEIDNTLIEIKDAETGPAFRNKNNSFDVHFAKTARNGKLVTLNKGDYEISWSISELENARLADVSAEVKNYEDTALNLSAEEKLFSVGKTGSEALYRSVLEGIDLRYIISSMGIKEEIILHEQPKNPTYAFDIAVNNLEALLNKDNTVVFYDPAKPEEAVFTLEAPFMYDNAEAHAFLSDIKIELLKTSTGYQLKIIPDVDWLNAPERVYPVVIDPTVTTSQDQMNIDDTFVHAGDTPGEHYVLPYMRVGNSSDGYLNRSFVKILQLPNIGSGSTVTDAKLNLYLVSGTSTYSNIDIYRVNSAWNTATITWTIHSGLSKTLISSNNSPSSMVYRCNVTNTVQSWYSGTTNHGFMVRYTNESVNDWNSFNTANFTGSSTLKPSITITYNSGTVQQPISHTEASNSTYYNWNYIYAASSIGFMGATWIPGRNKWEFSYRYVGTGASRADNLVRVAAMEIKGTSNTSNMAIWTSTSPQYIGSTPASTGSNPDYSDIATALAGFAITAINNLGVSYVWSAIGLINAFRSTVNSQSTTNTNVWRSWNWPSDIKDTGQFFWFLVDVNPSQTVQISHEYMVFGPGYELLSAGKGYRNLNAPGPQSLTMMIENWNPGMMSDEEKEKYGIEEIPLEQIEERAAELNISSATLEELYKSGEQVIYFAHNLLEYEVRPSADELNQDKTVSVTKHALIEEINTQMNRNEQIIKAFSSLENAGEEVRTIIEKNRIEQYTLKDLLSKVQLVNGDDLEAIELFWKELWNDILKKSPPSKYEK